MRTNKAGMVVYRHRRKDTYEVFYIGIGKNETRAFSKRDRNPHWKRVVEKHGYIVEIVSTPLTWEDACELEKLLISAYGRRDLGTGSLVNLTDGGDGSLGVIKSQKARFKSEETRRKISKSLTGKIQSEETKNKRRLTAIETWKSEELRELKRKQTKELIESGIITCGRGRKSPNKGKPFLGDKERLSESLKKYYQDHKPHNFKYLDDNLIENIRNDYKNGVLKFHLHKKYNLNRKIIDRLLCN